MSNAIVPDSHSNRLAFFLNLKQGIADNATELGFDAATLASIYDLLDPLIDKYQALVDAELAVVAASANADQVYTFKKDGLLALFANLRANPKLTGGMGEAMKIFSQTSAHDPNGIQPKIKVVAQPGQVRVTGSKDYAELVNIYMRLVGTVAWTLVGIRRKKFPFDDQTPLKVAGAAEVREYAARGVINDEEVGLMSDIVEVTFAG